MNLVNLSAQSIPLHGIHLIEASAGTGKTYNITRIYLRLLLERELTVQQILLVTFTKDATQELRARIDSFIREALTHWSQLCEQDSYFLAINQRIGRDKIEYLLKRALLFLDEAAIFTIHGFCQRVLSQHAFVSGLPFNSAMATDSSDIMLQACQDWYRQLAMHSTVEFNLVAKFWPTPNSFLSSFAKAIGHTSDISLVDAISIEKSFIELLQHAKSDLNANASLLSVSLIEVKKGADRALRLQELACLIQWLDELIDSSEKGDLLNQLSPMPDSFCDGRRFSRSKYKEQLQEAFTHINQVKKLTKTIKTSVEKAHAFALVKNGILEIRQQVIQTKQQLNILDFDDLINTLAEVLNTGDSRSDDLSKDLLTQYPVALVDEFQDTDPKQFAILQAIYFKHAAEVAQAGLYLIGDPKQAIYGFRGGDIFAYLDARKSCHYHWLMDTNWRSKPDVVDGYNYIFSDKACIEGGAKSSVFGYDIPYIPVKAGKKDKPNSSNDDDNNKAIQFIHFTAEKDKVTQSARQPMANWCAKEIGQLLIQKSINPHDIAILVRDGAEARDIKQALELAGLGSVFLSDRTNLFHSVQAKQLLSLLKAILH